MLSLNGITNYGAVHADTLNVKKTTGDGYDDVRTLIAAGGGGGGAVTSATTPLTITSGVLAIDLTTYATNATVNTSVNTAINNYATTDSSQLTAALALKQNNIISSTDIVAQDVTLRFLTGGNASSAFVLNSGNVLTVFKDNANNSLLSLSNAVSTFSTGVTFEDVIAFRKTISISDTANSLTGQLYIATGNKLKWQGQEVVTTDVMFADRIAKMQFDTAFSVVTQAATGGMIIAKNQSFQNSIVKFAGSTNSLRNVTSNSVDYLTWGADYLATIPYVGTQLATKQALITGNLNIPGELSLATTASSGGYGLPTFKFVAGATNYMSLGFSVTAQGSNNATEALKITRTGSVSITGSLGFASTTKNISVTGTGAAALMKSTAANFDIGDHTTGGCVVKLLSGTGGNTAQFAKWFTNHVFTGFLPEPGSVFRLYSGAAGHALDIALNRNITYYGTLASASDRRLKTSIEDVSLDDCLTLLSAVSMKTYQRIDEPGEDYRLGLIAQDVQENLPPKFSNLVGSFQHGDEGAREEMLSVSYDRLSCVLWTIVKQQQTTMQGLAQRLELLEGKKKKKAV